MRLASGDFLGDTLRSKQTPGIHMQLTQYSAGGTLPTHSHHSAYLCLVRAGGYVEKYGCRSRECQPGMLTFNPSGESHSQHVGTQRVVLFNIELDARWTARAMFSDPWSVSGGPLVHLAEGVYREFQSPDDLTPLAVEALLLEMAVSKRRSDMSACPKWMRLAIELLHESFRSPLMVRQLAEEVGVHPAHFSRAFRQHYGCTPVEYMRRLRLDAACQMLVTTVESGAVIADQCGFSDQSHMTRVFSKCLGMTPADYRRLMR